MHKWIGKRYLHCLGIQRDPENPCTPCAPDRNTKIQEYKNIKMQNYTSIQIQNTSNRSKIQNLDSGRYRECGHNAHRLVTFPKTQPFPKRLIYVINFLLYTKINHLSKLKFFFVISLLLCSFWPLTLSGIFLTHFRNCSRLDFSAHWCGNLLFARAALWEIFVL